MTPEELQIKIAWIEADVVKRKEARLARKRATKRKWNAANSKRVRLTSKEWYEANREYALQKAQEWRFKNREKVNEKAREWRAKNKQKVTQINRKSDLRRKYGMTIAEFEHLFEAQGRACSICKSKEAKCKNGWYVDHDHKTGKIHSIVCHFCNIMLGGARDDINNLLAGITYLREHHGREERPIESQNSKPNFQARPWLQPHP